MAVAIIGSIAADASCTMILKFLFARFLSINKLNIKANPTTISPVMPTHIGIYAPKPLERNFEIIGEAASRIPDDFKKLHPSVEWRIIKDFRNFIIHEYFGINDQIVWDTIQFRLPDLLQKISDLISASE